MLARRAGDAAGRLAAIASRRATSVAPAIAPVATRDLDALAARCADALAAIPPLRCSLTLDLEDDAETSRPAETLTLRVTLPRRYPAVAPTIEAAGSATSPTCARR